MDLQLHRRPPLEAIQEESEQEDEAVSGRSSEGECYPQEEEVLEEQEEEEEVLRPRSHSRLSSRSLSHIQSNEKEVQNVSVPGLSRNSIDGSKTSPRSDSREQTRSRSFWLKASEISWKRLSKRTPSVKKKKRKFKDEPFPPWVVNLMINIEEATSHELVVE
ncbi:hypothetical protein OJAV_G00175550 [Oryzias javanicus]|uniref:Uncharacterized protein n=1 Tax=Oryzias javanicus TaxID=123683 RepID=A0A3S2PUZ1_ORYJA|nr:hypothetical protein OJAV_G00175550 [Oryzias javanicus]